MDCVTVSVGFTPLHFPPPFILSFSNSKIIAGIEFPFTLRLLPRQEKWGWWCNSSHRNSVIYTWENRYISAVMNGIVSGGESHCSLRLIWTHHIWHSPDEMSLLSARYSKWHRMAYCVVCLSLSYCRFALVGHTFSFRVWHFSWLECVDPIPLEKDMYML